ncbi:MAG: HEAT repeat domain-containing protein, partial [Phycisphaerales bacterium]|nr:HEAT repeat domain-containing protein [Phycisphaerales bacterium]
MRAVRSAPLKIILIILILSLLAKVGEWVYYQIKFRKRGAARKVGFAGYKDFAKDPNRHETVRQIFKAHDDDLRSLRGKLIGELVNELATTRARKNVVTVIEEHAGAAMPALLKALDNPKFRTPYGDEHRKSGAVDYGVFSPLEVVLECLRSHPHPLMVPKVLPFVADANASVRGYVAAIICGFPDSATLPAIRELLVDSERNVRHNAVYTLNEAVNVGRVSASVRSELYPIVLSLVTDANKRTESAPACLLALDRPRAE